MREADFQQSVIEAAYLYGWLVFHPRPAQTGGRWSTPYTGHAGFPDLVLAHPEKGVLFVELKNERGRTTPGQRQWLNVLEDAGSETYLWRPQDWKDICARLEGN